MTHDWGHEDVISKHCVYHTKQRAQLTIAMPHTYKQMPTWPSVFDFSSELCRNLEPAG